MSRAWRGAQNREKRRDSTKSFPIDTIDIHEVENGKIVRVHHLEDWATAIRQLASK